MTLLIHELLAVILQVDEPSRRVQVVAMNWFVR